MSVAHIKDRIFKILFFLAFAAVAGCQSVQEKNLTVVRSRAVSLKPLMYWTPTQCRVEARPTQPMLSMYRTMFPGEQVDEIFGYTWKVHKFNCEITGLEDTRSNKNFHGFMKVALCTLLQTHWVNSPFEDLQIFPRDIKADKQGRIHIQSSLLDEDLGIFLDPAKFNIETKTKALGILRAEYSENAEHQWLPSRLEQISKSNFVVDSIEYDAVVTNGRHMIKSLWISVGGKERELARHAQLTFTECKGL